MDQELSGETGEYTQRRVGKEWTKIQKDTEDWRN